VSENGPGSHSVPDTHGSHRAPHNHGAQDTHGVHDATVQHTFPDAEKWAARFEDPSRDEWQRGDEVVRSLVTRDDMVIADIGSATGYFPIRFARAVPHGAVIGSDIEPGMVMYLNDRARTENFSNLTSVLAAPDDPHLPQRVDLVFICNTYHHINDRIEYLRDLRSQLQEDGRVAIVDFRLDSPRGPDHKLDPVRVQEEFAKAGYEIEVEHDFLPDQYFHVYRQGVAGQ